MLHHFNVSTCSTIYNFKPLTHTLAHSHVHSLNPSLTLSLPLLLSFTYAPILPFPNSLFKVCFSLGALYFWPYTRLSNSLISSLRCLTRYNSHQKTVRLILIGCPLFPALCETKLSSVKDNSLFLTGNFRDPILV